jgi:GxxExxY protein
MEPNETSGCIVDSSIKAHTSLGPGLLESAYGACPLHELTQRGLAVERQKAFLSYATVG